MTHITVGNNLVAKHVFQPRRHIRHFAGADFSASCLWNAGDDLEPLDRIRVANPV
jgi:hypothetical protein